MKLPHQLLFIVMIASCIWSCDLSNAPSAQFGQERTFFKLYGGADNFVGTEGRQTADGGYVLAGIKGMDNPTTLFFNPTLSGQMHLIKTDELGNTIWEYSYDTAKFSIATCMTIDQEGNYVLAGSSVEKETPNFPNNNLNITKVDQDGGVLWSREYGNFNRFGADVATDIQLASNGDYLVIGFTSAVVGSTENALNDNDIYALRINATDGSVVWERTYGLRSPLNDMGFAIKEDLDGNLIWLGTVQIGVNQSRMRLVKTDAEGTPLWDFDYPLQGGSQEAGDLLIGNAGYTVLGSEDNHFVLFQTNLDGQLLWSNTFDNISGANPLPASIAKAADGGLLLAGSLQENGSYNQMLIKASTAEGAYRWHRRFGAGDNDLAREVSLSSDGGIILSGTLGFDSNPLMSLIKTNAEGKLSEE